MLEEIAYHQSCLKVSVAVFPHMYGLKWKQPYVFLYLANSIKISVKILCYEGTVNIENKGSYIFGYLCDAIGEVERLETLSRPLVELSCGF